MVEEGPDRPGGLAALAERYGVSLDAVRHLLRALEAGHGTMAQFDHPDLGGMGQWFSGGMVMVGRMFDADLKARVAGLCGDLAASLPPAAWEGMAHASSSRSAAWYPADLGRPSTTGAQNGLRYAYFPQTRRLAIESGSGLALYDTGDHIVTGVAQADGTLRLSGTRGDIDLAALRRVDGAAPTPVREPAAAPKGAPAWPRQGASPGRMSPAAPAPDPARTGPGDVLTTLERLAELHAKGVLTEAEFTQKKAELLSRL
ncbi:SHOCT domain-containing protein [Methylobacterium nigriterrae]|uniref:SHOCT domain-containing protein n=1 Tax=Methylobacterium nigriterrae TaxID=3127512 RepID=UPI0030134C8C